MARMTFIEAQVILSFEQTERLTAAVDKGVELLDQQQPGWRDRIDVSSLDMHQGGSCVLGQLFGDYFDGRSKLGLNADDAIDHGFMALIVQGEDLSWEDRSELHEAQWATLDHLWTEKVNGQQ